MSIKEQFAAAQIAVKNLSEKPGNLDLLALYANFKQATDGDADGNRPSMTDFIARAKFDAWAALAGTQPEAAQQKYIVLVNRLVEQDPYVLIPYSNKFGQVDPPGPFYLNATIAFTPTHPTNHARRCGGF